MIEILSFYERKASHVFMHFVLLGLLILALRPLVYVHPPP